jgi:allantoinase
MTTFDSIVRGGNAVTPAGVVVVDIGITGGRIEAVQAGLAGTAREIIDASGCHVFPGLIDAHVHFNEPGRAHWEGFETGSRALAAGGGTLFFDMPLNSHPPTVDASSFDEKLAAAQLSSLVDFAFWGGLVPDNVDRLEELAGRGVVGFKAFMANSGIDDFPAVDDRTLRAGMKRAAALKKIVAVHAESEALLRPLADACVENGRTSVRDFLDSRPIRAELAAIERALELAGETGCALHVVHVSCGAGLTLIASAQALGVDVSCETCPHYLAFTEADVLELGAVAKCAPPLRPEPAQAGLWNYLQTGRITTVGSDHSPSPPDMKRDENFFKVWGGISGAQSTLPVLLTEGHVKRQMALPLISRVTSSNVAERFGLPAKKGRIAPGADADIAVVDLGQTSVVAADDLFYRHRHSPYVGRALTGRVIQTILRGQTVFKNGRIVSKPLGRLVKPPVAPRNTA